MIVLNLLVLFLNELSLKHRDPRHRSFGTIRQVIFPLCPFLCWYPVACWFETNLAAKVIPGDQLGRSSPPFIDQADNISRNTGLIIYIYIKKKLFNPQRPDDIAGGEKYIYTNLYKCVQIFTHKYTEKYAKKNTQNFKHKYTDLFLHLRFPRISQSMFY